MVEDAGRIRLLRELISPVLGFSGAYEAEQGVVGVNPCGASPRVGRVVSVR